MQGANKNAHLPSHTQGTETDRGDHVRRRGQKAAIESDFGEVLDWQELPDGEGCRIRYVVDGGYKSSQDQWPAIHASLADAMVRLEKAMRQRVAQLTV